jgi:hypothetical protein
MSAPDTCALDALWFMLAFAAGLVAGGVGVFLLTYRVMRAHEEKWQLWAREVTAMRAGQEP